jgi:ribosomal protein S10
MYKIELHIKSFDQFYINLAVYFVKNFLYLLNVTNVTQVFLPKKLKKFTVLRSPHIDKKSREQFEIRTYKRLLIIKLSCVFTTILLLETLKHTTFPGSQMKIITNYNTYWVPKRATR